MRAIYLLIIFLAFFSSACTKDSFVKEVPYPTQTSAKLVVVSYISPAADEQIKVSVSLSRPAYGPGVGKMNMDAQIKDADVIISDAAGRFAHILWNDKIGQYVLEKNRFPINTGKIYYLKVSAHGKFVSAKTSIPEAILGPKFELVETIARKDHQDGRAILNEYLYRFSAPWDGLVDGGYYGCYPVLDRITKYNNDSDKSQKNTYGDISKTGKVFFRTYDRVSNALPFDHLIMIEHTTFSDENLSSKVVTHTGVFIACSKEYYLFHKTAPNNIKSAGDSGNPLAPPVGNVYSNIEGGYGIFAGYNQVTLVGTSTYGN